MLEPGSTLFNGQMHLRLTGFAKSPGLFNHQGLTLMAEEASLPYLMDQPIVQKNGVFNHGTIMQFSLKVFPGREYKLIFSQEECDSFAAQSCRKCDKEPIMTFNIR